MVLGGGHVSDPRLPANSQIGAAALGRLVEGVRLHKAIPGSKLLLSGGAVFDPVPEAEVMARIAEDLGVRTQDIRLERDSRDTAEEAEIIAKMIGGEKSILVTSTAHTPAPWPYSESGHGSLSRPPSIFGPPSARRPARAGSFPEPSPWGGLKPRCMSTWGWPGPGCEG